ncbi:DUF3298 and DUF4163 domain-containing protein [Lysobacter sp. KIS68-7]|uniref:DUF3298 and DUF4163 domain-containing protein n=1 Tax=Lysobacter sp. KIS68-7 TaxID=2904252 RepID=UPI001E38D39E|nr:DUF3298 and DUF4163 domain-containing protein [Lysobacter sp. KIS68-7]UHQ19249.1 DUF3298 and DUF4163 domain-containing protein [Lysobacter sp. KIS68-7]
MTRRSALAIVSVLLLAACQRQAPAPATTTPHAPATASTAVAPASAASVGGLHDVVETTPRYVIGISYPKEAAAHPGLAAALKRYADASRKDLMDAVDGLGNDTPTAPYELSLSYTTLVNTPAIIAIAADGSLYTGGAHGSPLIARFVWLPQHNVQLTAEELVPDATGWQVISDFVREQLHTALSQRIDADDVPAEDRADMLKQAVQMIDEGTGPTADAFSEFEPRLGADGKIDALRFVFPPYQVGPYADGTQTVDVPADVLLPHVAPAYRGLFRGG